MKLLPMIAAISVLYSSLCLGAGPSPRPDQSARADLEHGLETRATSTPNRRAPAASVDQQGRPTRESPASFAGAAAAPVVVACSTAELESFPGYAPIDKIKTCDVTSLNELYSVRGAGDANLYVGATWTTMINYQYASTNSGNAETLTISSSPTGWMYISLHAASAFSGVKVTTEY